MPLVKIVRPSVAQPVCKPPMQLGRASIRRSGVGRERIRRRAGIDRRMVQDPPVLGPQDVEAAVLAAHADHLGRLALDRDRVDLGRVADRLVLVPPFLGVVGPHGIGPDVAGVDLRDPLLGRRRGRRAR